MCRLMITSVLVLGLLLVSSSVQEANEKVDAPKKKAEN
jgi:hypothetical protein